MERVAYVQEEIGSVKGKRERTEGEAEMDKG